MYHRSLFNIYRYPNGKLYEDISLTYKLIIDSGSIVVTDKPLYYYLQRDNGICRSIFNKNKVALIENVNEVRTYIKDNIPELIKYVDLFYIRNLCNFLLQMPLNYVNRKKYFTEYKKIWKFAFKSNLISKQEKIKLILVRFNLNFIYFTIKKVR